MVNLVNMPVSRERMEKYQNRHFRQIEHAAKQSEAREMKVKSNTLRKEWLERQNKLSYRNEYDGIRGELGNRKIPFRTKYQLEKRQGDLQKLFSSGNV
jgi:hypothetical protein